MDKQIKSNSGKCRLISSTDDVTEIQIGDSVIKNSNHEKYVKADNILNFDSHVKNICTKQETN